jgi:Na+/H+ antiporter NhaC
MGTLFNKALSQTVVLASSTNSKDLAEEIKYAALNTVVGLVVVFAILTIIIFVISLFKIIPYLQNKLASGKESSEAVDNVVAQITEQEEAEEELINDCELVAVITAAIYASMGSEAPADGLVVRSIRRAGKKSWVNA